MPIVNCAFAFSLSAKENKINAKENKIIFDFLKNDCEVKCTFEDIEGGFISCCLLNHVQFTLKFNINKKLYKMQY
jgi:hypothetical protein